MSPAAKSAQVDGQSSLVDDLAEQIRSFERC